jgi:hypothetical protein
MKKLENLRRISVVKYEMRQSAYQKLLARENALRDELLKVSLQENQARSTKDSKMCAVGADMIWEAWLEKAKISLNNDLAQVLSLKHQQREVMKKAYGRVIATQNLMNAEADTKRKMAEYGSKAACLDVVSKMKRNR